MLNERPADVPSPPDQAGVDAMRVREQDGAAAVTLELIANLY